jgi:tryptophanyl-tRNA synthetase
MSSTLQTHPARRSTALLADAADVLADPSRYRVLTGDRPTGPLHVGHYLGTLRERVRLQDAGVETIVVVADYQVVTDRLDTSGVGAAVREIVLDYLAAGLDPRRTKVFAHSAVPEIGQLMLPLLAMTTVAELRRNPTVKAEAAEDGTGALSALMLTYPVHQAADILSVEGTLVPVGDDQLPHIEQARVIARRLNDRYGAGAELVSPPQALLTSAPRLLGTDGRKMSKSRGNAIALRATEDETARLVRSAVTDSERDITFEPSRRPEVASLLLLGALCLGCSPEELAAEVGSGAARLKTFVAEAVNEHLRPLRARRSELAGRAGLVDQVLADGADAVRPIAAATLARVHEAMRL